MIALISGKLLEATPLEAIVLAGGIGYRVHIPVTTAEKLPPAGKEVTIFIQAVYREDSQALYGFAVRSDRDLFALIVEKVSGIGPRIAINMMSRMSSQTLVQAITTGDVALISKCPGIGKKTAERLVIELKDKLGGSIASGTSSQETIASPIDGSVQQNAFADAVAALIALGYKAPDADNAIRKASQKLGADSATEALIRAALNGYPP